MKQRLNVHYCHHINTLQSLAQILQSLTQHSIQLSLKWPYKGTNNSKAPKLNHKRGWLLHAMIVWLFSNEAYEAIFSWSDLVHLNFSGHVLD